MHMSFCRRAALLPILALFAASVQPAVAQPSEEPAPPFVDADEGTGEALPWLYENSDVPVDRAWTFGELENGLRYAVRNNGVPPGQISVRIRIDAGSLMESDAQRGYAHLLEHLSFRSSKYIPDGEAIKVWQRFGVTFGSDSNAETTPTQTVYKLDLPSATPASFDEAMKILSGMIQEPGISKNTVSAEVPVVLAELRERAGAQARISDATRELFFTGQPLAVRSPIGTQETLKAATAATVRDFHNGWYRPENVVIAIAGDFEPAMLEQEIGQYFADWKASGDPIETPDFGQPQDDGPTTDVLVEPGLPHLLTYAVLRPWYKVNDTIEYNQQLLIDLVAQQLINRRLEARARAGGSFLQASVSQDDVNRSADATFVSIIPLGDDWQAALQDVRGVIADATSVPPTEAEIEREIAEFDAALAVGVETADTDPGSEQADNIVHAVDIRETIATPETALTVFREMRPLYTPERILKSTQALFTGTTTRALLVAPDGEQSDETELASAIEKDVVADPDARIADAQVTFDDLPELGEPSTLESAQDIDLLGMEIITLSNGVKALLYANDAEVSKINVKVRFGRGYQAFSPDEIPSIWAAEAALVSSGIGDLDQEQLDRLTTGRRIGFNFAVENDAFAFSADTRPADLEDQLRLFAAKLEAPGWNPAPVLRAKAGSKLAYESYGISPAMVLERDLEWLTHNRDLRWKTPEPAEIDALSPEQFEATWAPLLALGKIEVLLFGDFERDVAIDALNKTLGALPVRQDAAVAEGGASASFPEPGGDPVVLRHKGDADQAAIILAWPTGGGLANIRESRQLEILSSLFNNRLFEQLRDQAGASYSPQVINDWPVEFEQGGHIAAISQLDPSAIPTFLDIAEGIVADLVANPVSADELERITGPLRQLISRASTGNQFWLSQLEGATRDPARITALRSLLRDYTVTTPEEMQVLAAKYLDGKGWKLLVLPEDAAVPDDM